MKRDHSMALAIMRHDAAIIRAALRTTIRRTADLLTIVIAIPALLLAARAWLDGLPPDLRAGLSAAVAALVSFVVVGLIINRLDYHRTDGVLARYALDSSAAAKFFAAALVLAEAGAAMIGLVLDMVFSWHWIAGAGAGALGAALWGWAGSALDHRRVALSAFAKPGSAKSPRSLAIMAGGGLATGAAIAMLPFDFPFTAMLATGAALIVAPLIAAVDARTVRFWTMIGHGSGAIWMAHAGHVAAFYLPFSIGLLASGSIVIAAIGAGIGISLALIAAFRVLTYRILPQRLADWVLAAVFSTIAVMAIAVPVLVPVLVLGPLLWFARRAAGREWHIE